MRARLAGIEQRCLAVFGFNDLEGPDHGVAPVGANVVGNGLDHAGA